MNINKREYLNMKLMKRSFLGLFSPFVLGLAADCSVVEAATSAAPPKPNIVHIMIDDLGWQDIASHKIDGKAVYETPNLDRFTSNGRRFTQAYSPAPTCAPSRSSFLRGQYPARTGIYHVTGSSVPMSRGDTPMLAPYYRYGLPAEAPTVAGELQKAGYATGHVGKWHAGGRHEGYPFATDIGFDFGFSDIAGKVRNYNDLDLWNPADGDKLKFFGMWSRQKPTRLDDFATDEPDDPFRVNAQGRPFDKPLDMAVGFIRENKEQPFFLSYCTFYVHGPIGTRDRERLAHYCKKMGYEFPEDPGVMNLGKSGHTNPYYASMVDSVDWMVGEVLAYLEKTDDPRNPGHKLIDNTYVVVDADNGGTMIIQKQLEPVTDNSPLRGGKLTVFEGGIRVPFIVSGPGIEAGTTVSTPIHMIDLFPTFLAIAGREVDPALELEGCNILPLFEGKAETAYFADGKERESLFWYFPVESHMASVIRKGDWKLIENYGMYWGKAAPAGVALYRLTNQDGSFADLGESNNLADQEPAIRDELLAELHNYLEDLDVCRPYQNPEMASPAQFKKIPAVIKVGYEKDRVWAEFEKGDGKSPIVEAFLLYSVNPPPFDTTGGHREEWLRQPATLSQGRVEATMPPGATHGVFCMRDAGGYLVTSQERQPKDADAEAIIDWRLDENYPYRPGLFALIELGKQALESSRKAGLDTGALEEALVTANLIYPTERQGEIVYANVFRELRSAIRNQKGIAEAETRVLNLFPKEPLF